MDLGHKRIVLSDLPTLIFPRNIFSHEHVFYMQCFESPGFIRA